MDGNNKRKRNPSPYETKIDFSPEEKTVVDIRRTERSNKLMWTPELNVIFLESLQALGPDAVPKQLHAKMNVAGLTRSNVASHLQKFRQKLNKPKYHGLSLLQLVSQQLSDQILKRSQQGRKKRARRSLASSSTSSPSTSSTKSSPSPSSSSSSSSFSSASSSPATRQSPSFVFAATTTATTRAPSPSSIAAAASFSAPSSTTPVQYAQPVIKVEPTWEPVSSPLVVPPSPCSVTASATSFSVNEAMESLRVFSSFAQEETESESDQESDYYDAEASEQNPPESPYSVSEGAAPYLWTSLPAPTASTFYQQHQWTAQPSGFASTEDWNPIPPAGVTQFFPFPPFESLLSFEGSDSYPCDLCC